VAAAPLLLTACSEQSPTSDEGLDPFLTTYVQLLNDSDESGLARHLSTHPYGTEDARVRMAGFGGQGWKVRWTKESEFAGVWSVRLRGSRGPGASPVDVTEVLSHQDGAWMVTPMDGVVPKRSGAADTTRPR
jgi:hypothetical protein